jgi:type II secretory ATPase GspE/PulE/Tfp pilus assembly ATPase PilB-like protein
VIFEELPSGEVADVDTLAVALLRSAIDARASDIHLDPNQDAIDVRLRVDGRLLHFDRLERRAGAAMVSQLKLMANLDIAEPFRSKEGRLRLPAGLAGYEVRLTTARAADGETAALRILDSRRLRLPLDGLGFSPEALVLVQAMLRHGEGLILVTGPTNAGKTTTVYSMLHELDNGERNIVTIEDPVEYDMPSFVQMEVDPRHEITMTSGLRTLLRLDPDVVLVGEIRDAETAEIAMRAASSGKLVLSTLHTRDVASTVTALRDLHVDNRSLAGNLAGIVSQRLVRCVCQECCRREPPTQEEGEFFREMGRAAPEIVPHATGCGRCRGTGYFDRVGVFEVAAGLPAVSAAIGAGVGEEELRRLLRRDHVPTLVDDALDKVSAGITTADEVQAMHWISSAPRHDRLMSTLAKQATASESLPAPLDPDSTFRVVVFAAPDDPLVLRDLLVHRLNMHPTDAQVHARAVPGILPDRLTREAAEQFAAAVNEAGLHAEAVRQSDIPDFEHAEAVHHARCLEEGFEVIEVHGEEESIVPWSRIELVSVGQVPQEEDRHFISTDEITASRRAAPTDCFVTQLAGPELWVVRRDPLKAYRVDHQRMNYEYLGAAMTSSATRNFRLFVEDLVRRIPSAYVTPATRTFLEHGPTRHYEFDSTDQLRGYTVFHLLIRLRAENQTAERREPTKTDAE